MIEPNKANVFSQTRASAIAAGNQRSVGQVGRAHPIFPSRSADIAGKGHANVPGLSSGSAELLGGRAQGFQLYPADAPTQGLFAEACLGAA